MDEDVMWVTRDFGLFKTGEEVLVLHREGGSVRVHSASGYSGYLPLDALTGDRPEAADG